MEGLKKKIIDMKKLILLLLFIPLFSLGQDFNDALNFLKKNEPDWACERFAVQTSEKRLEISLSKDNSKLILKMNRGWIGPLQYGFDGGYIIAEIDLSKVVRIEIDDNGKPCAGIDIITEPYGASVYRISDDGKITRTRKDFDGDLPKWGWAIDFIRIKTNYSFKERSERIKKSLEFMAIQNGANLQESYF